MGHTKSKYLPQLDLTLKRTYLPTFKSKYLRVLLGDKSQITERITTLFTKNYCEAVAHRKQRQCTMQVYMWAPRTLTRATVAVEPNTDHWKTENQ